MPGSRWQDRRLITSCLQYLGITRAPLAWIQKHRGTGVATVHIRCRYGLPLSPHAEDPRTDLRQARCIASAASPGPHVMADLLPVVAARRSRRHRPRYS